MSWIKGNVDIPTKPFIGHKLSEIIYFPEISRAKSNTNAEKRIVDKNKDDSIRYLGKLIQFAMLK